MSFSGGVKFELGRTVVQLFKWAVALILVVGLAYGAYYYAVERPRQAAADAVRHGREAVGKVLERADKATAPIRDRVGDKVQDAVEASRARIDDLRARLPGAKSKNVGNSAPVTEPAQE